MCGPNMDYYETASPSDIIKTHLESGWGHEKFDGTITINRNDTVTVEMNFANDKVVSITYIGRAEL